MCLPNLHQLEFAGRVFPARPSWFSSYHLSRTPSHNFSSVLQAEMPLPFIMQSRLYRAVFRDPPRAITIFLPIKRYCDPKSKLTGRRFALAERRFCEANG